MLKLTDLLAACRINLDLTSYKVHLATTSGSGDSPLIAFFEGRFKEWQETQTRKNFPVEMVVGLIEYRPSKWLFAGVYRVLGAPERLGDGYRYSTEVLPGQEDLVGRVIVHHDRRARQAYLYGHEDGGEFYVSEMTEEPISVQEFPGYDAVRIDNATLKVIVSQNVESWRVALRNIKGVYLISDLLTGRLYVGSATAGDGIWQRWAAYAATGHGGNRDLRAVLEEKGPDYCANFQYSILEIADSHCTDERVVERESFWKNVLLTREFGFNAN